MLAKEETPDRLRDDPDARCEHENGFDEGRKAFNFAVTVVVLFIRRSVSDVDGEERYQGSDEIDRRVCGLGQHAERAGEDPGKELQ